MFEISEKASEMIKGFLKERGEMASIRFMISEGG